MKGVSKKNPPQDLVPTVWRLQFAQTRGKGVQTAGKKSPEEILFKLSGPF